MTTASSEQVAHLLNYLNEHHKLARGQLRSAEGRIRSRLMWQKLTQNLNAIEGARKNVKQWQKVWSDKKYLAKKAATEARKLTSAIGVDGGSPTASGIIKDSDIMVLNIMGEQFRQPDTITVRSIPSPLSASEEEQSPEIEEASDVAPSPVPPRRQRRFTPTSTRTSQRVPRGDGLYGRLLRMEEKKVAVETMKTHELRAIRHSLDKLVGLVQEFVNTRREGNNV